MLGGTNARCCQMTFMNRQDRVVDITGAVCALLGPSTPHETPHAFKVTLLRTISALRPVALTRNDFKFFSSPIIPCLWRVLSLLHIVMSTTADDKRGSLSRSCEFCRMRKVRCNAQRPSCGSCIRHKQRCVYITSIPKARSVPLLLRVLTVY